MKNDVPSLAAVKRVHRAAAVAMECAPRRAGCDQVEDLSTCCSCFICIVVVALLRRAALNVGIYAVGTVVVLVYTIDISAVIVVWVRDLERVAVGFKEIPPFEMWAEV
jgi:hypothetical protein